MKLAFSLMFVIGLAATASAQSRPQIPPDPPVDAQQACIQQSASQGAPRAFWDLVADCRLITQPRYNHPVPIAPTYGGLPIIVPAVGTEPYYPYGGGYNGYYGAYYYDPCRNYLPPNARDRNCVMAELKFKLTDDERRDRNDLADEVTVKLDGNFVGLIGKYTHGATSGLSINANQEHRLTLEWKPKGQAPITIEERINLQSIRLQDGAYWFPVSKDRFVGGAYSRDIQPTRESVDGKEYITGNRE